MQKPSQYIKSSTVEATISLTVEDTNNIHRPHDINIESKEVIEFLGNTANLFVASRIREKGNKRRRTNF